MTRIQKLTEEEYQAICSQLQINCSKDRDAAEQLKEQLAGSNTLVALKKLRRTIQSKNVLIFGAGPSLEQAVEKVSQLLITEKNKKEVVVLAVDGATKALQEKNVPIDIIVTDLDGDLEAVKKGYFENKAILVIHAHGDNIDKIKSCEELLQLEGRVIGTTQTENIGTIINLGGFTDGDRAVYIAGNMQASKVFLFGFDFGQVVGRYSKPGKKEHYLASTVKIKKLAVAKELLSKVSVRFPRTEFFNCTTKGEQIANIKTIDFEKLIQLLD